MQEKVDYLWGALRLDYVLCLVTPLQAPRKVSLAQEYQSIEELLQVISAARR
jgi:hypothetical protein